MLENKKLVTDIYREICKKMDIQLDDSHRRLLNKRLSFLLEQVAFVNKQEIKGKQNKMYVPMADAAIIRNILYKCETEDGDILVKWINGSWDINDPRKCLLLAEQIIEPIRVAEDKGETDSVTADEWISAIKCLIGYEYARQVCDLEKQMRMLRDCSIGTSTCVEFGTIYVDDGMGNRSYALPKPTEQLPLSDELLNNIVEQLCTANDYFVAMNQITQKMVEKMNQDVLQNLDTFAGIKSIMESDKLYEREEDAPSLVSEYIPYYNKLADYCNMHPDAVKEIEERHQIDSLEEFLRCKYK